MIFELIGIAGTLFVLASFLMKDYRKTRIINIVGAALFVIYGITINALSTWLLNSVLIFIHIYFLWKGNKNNRRIK